METKAYCKQCQDLKLVKIEEKGRCQVFTCQFCGLKWRTETRRSRQQFSQRMQKIAIEKVYGQVFPNYSIIEVDTLPSELAKRLDIGGIDKVLFAPDGHIIQVGQRFRQADVWEDRRRRDFTIREAELRRHLAALQNGGTVPTYYVYGYATEDEEDFIRLFIVRYREWLENLGHDHRPRLLKPKKPRQERFYCESWAGLPNRYIAFAYPIDEPRQLSLF